MKIICAGFMKTGTKSLAEALRILGYRVFDYDEQFLVMPELWEKFFNGTVTDDDIRDCLKDVDAIVDGPAIAFWEEIWRAVPGAKIILSTRDEESWWQSFQGMHNNIPLHIKLIFVAIGLLPTGRTLISQSIRVFRYCLGTEGLFQLPYFHATNNARLHKFKFRQHNSHVLRSVPVDKLLVYPVGSGWATLCQFLNVDCPVDVLYPHKNKEGAHMKEEGGPKNEKFQQLKKEACFLLTAVACIFGLICLYIVSLLL